MKVETVKCQMSDTQKKVSVQNNSKKKLQQGKKKLLNNVT